MLRGVLGEHDHVGGQLIHLFGDVGDAIVAEQQVHRGHLEPGGAVDRVGLLVGERERRAQHHDPEADRGRDGGHQETASPQRHECDGDHDDAQVGGERLSDDDERCDRPSERLGRRDGADAGDDRPRREFDRGRSASIATRLTAPQQAT